MRVSHSSTERPASRSRRSAVQAPGDDERARDQRQFVGHAVLRPRPRRRRGNGLDIMGESPGQPRAHRDPRGAGADRLVAARRHRTPEQRGRAGVERPERHRSGQRAPEDAGCGRPECALGGLGHRSSQGEDRSPVRVLRPDGLEPAPVHVAEVPEPAGRLVDGLVEVAERAPRRPLHRLPADHAGVHQVHLEVAGDVVGARAVGRVRRGPDDVLGDRAERAQLDEVAATHGRQRQDGFLGTGRQLGRPGGRRDRFPARLLARDQCRRPPLGQATCAASPARSQRRDRSSTGSPATSSNRSR